MKNINELQIQVITKICFSQSYNLTVMYNRSKKNYEK